MKKLLLLALCGILASGSAEARTLYVNARRPNNNGNGLKPKTAKKTIQAAINIARYGDTILVYPGTYSPFDANKNKYLSVISVKAVKGAGKTKIILPKASKAKRIVRLTGSSKIHHIGNIDYATYRSELVGFTLDGQNQTRPVVSASSPEEEESCHFVAVEGGNVRSCIIQGIVVDKCDCDNGRFSTASIAWNCNLTACTIKGNDVFDSAFWWCRVNRCTIMNNVFGDGVVGPNCILSNCLIVKNTVDSLFRNLVTERFDTLFVNCSIADNRIEVPSPFDLQQSDGKVAAHSKFYNCIIRNNYAQTEWTEWEPQRRMLLDIAKSENVYRCTFTNNRNPKFTSAYKLKKGSPCINRGKLSKTLKKIVGTKDLAGRKRVRGKAVDMGCYEY